MSCYAHRSRRRRVYCSDPFEPRLVRRMEREVLHHARDVPWDDAFVFGAGGLGVRRPLRFLAYRLDLSDDQVSAVAKVLERLKIERAQARVDLRRSASELADAVETESFGSSSVEAARHQRLDAAARVQTAVSGALEELHRLLDEAQRRRLADLIRTGGVRF